MRSIPTPSFVFALMLSTLYGALFHLWQGGDGRRLGVYLVSSWLGFTIGQFIADLLTINILNVGPVHVLTATFGSLVSLVATRVLVPSLPRQ